MYYVYALSSMITAYVYVGLSNDVRRRISEHDHGKSNTTRSRRPFTVLLIEEYPDRKSARQREKYLKSGEGKELLKSLKK